MNGNWKRHVKAEVTIEREWVREGGGVGEVRLCHNKTYMISPGVSTAF